MANSRLKQRFLQSLKLAVPLLLAWNLLLLAPVQALSVAELIGDLKTHYPPLEQARLKRELIAGKLLEKQGNFDTKIKSKVIANPLGYYRNLQMDTVIEQATPWWGATFFSGYRLGRGSFADYDGKKETLDLGEIRAGFELPLLRDRELDSRRVDLQALELQLQMAELGIFEKQLKFTKEALKGYWSWVAAQQKKEIYFALLQLAEVRIAQLKTQIGVGKYAPVEALENQRSVLKRQNKLLEQIQELQQQALELGLYLKQAERLNPAVSVDFPETIVCNPAPFKANLQQSLQQRPESLTLALQKQQNQLGQDLARNQSLPNLGLYLVFAQDLGQGSKTKQGFEAESGLSLEWPIQMRKAEGQLQQLQVEAQQLELEQQFLERQIQNQLLGVQINLETACAQIALARQEVTLASQLAQAEMDRFVLGGTTLYIVNKLEQEAAESRLRLIDAKKAYYVAVSESYLVQGLLPVSTHTSVNTSAKTSD